MLPDRVSNPGPLTYESGALPIALRGPANWYLNILSVGLEWLSRDKLLSLLYALVTYRHVTNWLTHLLGRSQITSSLDSRLDLQQPEPDQNGCPGTTC